MQKGTVLPESGTLFDSDQLADWVGCTRTHVYAMIRQGMPAMRLGTGKRSEWRFSLAAVKRWLRDCATVNAVEEPAAGSIQDDDLFRERSICRRR